MSMIPNPRKKVTVDFTIAEIKSTLVKLPAYFANKYTLNNRNDIMSQYTFSASEFLSFGVFVDINLNSITDTKSEIIAEVRRKLGAFDRWYEVQQANQHIDYLFNGISNLLTKVRETSAQNTISVDVENPKDLVKYDISWDSVKKNLNKLITTYPGTYKLVSETSEETVIRRVPQVGDDVVLDVDAILKISPNSSNNTSSEIIFEITNDNNKIATQGELNRNKLIMKITIKLFQKIIDTLKTKLVEAETELEKIKKWKIGRSEVTKQEQITSQMEVINKLKQQLTT